ncbi:MAG: hypothetical protein JNJ78_22835 [Anaerolineae bacterium]|nr:hypothetical protein [Anaerolineae bacterium]
MFNRERIMEIVWPIANFVWKTALFILLFVIGSLLFIGAQQSETPNAVKFNENIGIGVATTALILLIMHWWQMDGTGEIKKDLKDLKIQNKLLEEKLNVQTTLLQQLVDNANQPTLINIPSQNNLVSIVSSSDQVETTSNNHIN